MKDSLNIDGKIYISSRRAAEISKYSNDYVGQLCRAGKVAARMMGRTWFVDQASILAHKKNAEVALQERSRILSSKRYSPYEAVHAPVAGAAVGTFTVSHPMLPLLQSPIPSLKWEFTRRLNDVPMSGLFDLLAKPLGSNAVTATALAFVMAVTAGWFAANNYAALSSSLTIASSNVGSQTASAISSLDGIANIVASDIGSVLADGYGRTVAFVKSLGSGLGAIVAQRAPGTENINGLVPSTGPSAGPSATVPVAALATSTASGIVVVPSAAGSGGSLAAAEQQIRDSFSDHVEIKPEQNGTAGVITPVFKDKTGGNYVYVMVPVKATTTGAQK
ncbi:MAG: hypothetical protein KGI49_03295 [Patescibacteria group bacterium]|nr:hypothetical protein [Patescibacteria group bacterium]